MLLLYNIFFGIAQHKLTDGVADVIRINIVTFDVGVRRVVVTVQVVDFIHCICLMIAHILIDRLLVFVWLGAGGVSRRVGAPAARRPATVERVSSRNDVIV